MDEVTFITGNKHKAEYLQRLLGIDVAHQKIELDEIQSIDLDEIVKT
jgi:inosine/xanthosine triphosphate pyrophosphatase family protein